MTHTHSKIKLHYFWPGMSDFVRDRITACHKCIARKSPVNHQPMGHVPVSGRFERVAMDLLGDALILHNHSFRHISYLGLGEPSLLCHFITSLLASSLFVYRYLDITLDG